MSQQTMIGGAAYEITEGRTLVDGTEYDIYQGRTLVGATGYDILLGMRLRELPVGDSVFMNVDGVLTEFLIVHQGNPDSSIYDDSCNGTWVLMKGVYGKHHWDNESSHYPDSDIHNYLNNEFAYRLDANLRSRIKQVKIPYARQNIDGENDGNWGANDRTSVHLGSEGLSAKIFLLSAPEVNWYNAYVYGCKFFFNYEGSCLDYFKGFAPVDIRRNGIPHPTRPDATGTPWWLRSKERGALDKVTSQIFVTTSGDSDTSNSATGESSYYGIGIWVRPAMILPPELLVKRKTHVIIC